MQNQYLIASISKFELKKDGKWVKKVRYLRRVEKVFLVWTWTQGETERQYKKDG